jgi:hypothetical protein
MTLREIARLLRITLEQTPKKTLHLFQLHMPSETLSHAL